ncbi:MAG: peptidoglycan-binding protein [Cyanobacteria bacterium P01_H01_bin.121]
MESLLLVQGLMPVEGALQDLQFEQFSDQVSRTTRRTLTTAILPTVIATSALLLDQPEAQAIVQEGDVCAAVGDLQIALADLGFYGGPIDDIFGFGTLAALEEYQFFAGLGVDGIAGPATADSLGLGNASFYSGRDFCSGFTPVGPGPGPVVVSGTYEVVASSGLNIRRRPTTGSAIIGGLGFGEVVDTVGVSDNGFIELADGGWISTEYIVAVGGSGGDVFDGETFEVTADVLNIRSEPFFANNVIEDFRFGDVFTTTGVSRNGFVQLVDGGWVSEAFIRPVFVAGRF